MQLAQLFPSLKRYNALPTIQNTSTSLFYDTNNCCWYEIAKSDLTARDYLFLTHFLEEYSDQQDPWMQLLTKGVIPKKTSYSSIRILQYATKMDAQQLKSAIELYFIHDAYLLEASPHRYWIILFKDYTLEEIEGFFAILENDFYIHGQLFIGQMLPISDKLHASFTLEQTLFQSIQTQQFQTIYTFTNSLLYLLPFQLNIPLQHYLKQTMFHHLNEEMLSTITTLFFHNGNMSSAAKELHIHRNTFLYRVQRFSEETALDLKRSDDLLLAYLAAQLYKLTKFSL